MSEKIKSILLTGPPGVGKTTIIRKLIEKLQKQDTNCCGFYTEEVRSENGIRIGFDVVSLDGKRSILARQFTNDSIKRPKVGKYHVYVKEFEEIALPVLTVTPKTLLIIDEIGKMELLSEKFNQQILNIFGKTAILATIPVQLNYTEKLKSQSLTITVRITKENRSTIVDNIFDKAMQML